jgi:DNA-binding NtrC family response regulator
MKRQILVVDDAVDLRELIRKRLQALGFGVVVAENGFSGLDALRRIRVDGVLLDVDMPAMDGVTMIHALRQQNPRLPVILMLGLRAPDALAEVLRDSATYAIPKPLNLTRLEQRCEEIFAAPYHRAPVICDGQDASGVSRCSEGAAPARYPAVSERTS